MVDLSFRYTVRWMRDEKDYIEVFYSAEQALEWARRCAQEYLPVTIEINMVG